MNKWADNAAAGWRDRQRAVLRRHPWFQLLLGSGALALAVIMLGGFYVVIQQGVAQAHTHWANASPVIAGCNPTGRDHCLAPATAAKLHQVSHGR